MLVKEMMRKPVTVISIGATIGEADQLLQSRGFRHLPVVDQGRLVGILTDRDIRFTTSSLSPTPRRGDDSVTLAMSSPPLTADPLDPVEDAARIMREHKIGCLPVLDGGELVGILTGMDLLDALMTLTGVTKPSSRLEVVLRDQPGELARLTTFFADRRVNIHSILTYPTPDTTVRTVLRVDSNQIRPLAEELRGAGFTVLWPLPKSSQLHLTSKPWQP
ncbi:MAG: CBS domain-containing protein [Holophagaceae bacterium]|jgi:acetoin utilization protein AcuB|uniref:CBS domain-containing protein n=1 Tax=Candidatus Geothrix odensensis TaxID=2954440 RepID=A0A936F2J4_9BACT|nr:CBS domain-containing protein [Candidatus Geothrix odensensis]MBK8790404.1 CBS domain-containing protein [Holophagaceae bacterium]